MVNNKTNKIMISKEKIEQGAEELYDKFFEGVKVIIENHLDDDKHEYYSNAEDIHFNRDALMPVFRFFVLSGMGFEVAPLPFEYDIEDDRSKMLTEFLKKQKKELEAFKKENGIDTNDEVETLQKECDSEVNCKCNDKINRFKNSLKNSRELMSNDEFKSVVDDTCAKIFDIFSKEKYYGNVNGDEFECDSFEKFLENWKRAMKKYGDA